MDLLNILEKSGMPEGHSLKESFEANGGKIVAIKCGCGKVHPIINYKISWDDFIINSNTLDLMINKNIFFKQLMSNGT